MSNESQVLEVSTDSATKQATGKASLVTSSGASKFQDAQVHLAGDVWHYFTAGAPVDYTDGTPPATGEGEAGIGSLCTRLDTGKLYVNGGTKAQPLWKIVTSA